MAPTFATYGVHPKGTARLPLVHTRIEDMVAHYCDAIRSIQPRGPYLLGGLDVGGFLAVEVSRQLHANGERVGPVALFDAPHWRAQRKSVNSTKLAPSTLLQLARSRVGQYRQHLAAKLLHYHLANERPVPAYLRNTSVATLVQVAVRDFVQPEPYRGQVLLFRATAASAAFAGILTDTPAQELYVEPDLGWKHEATNLLTYSLAAGHMSLLCQPDVREVAAYWTSHIRAWSK